MKLNKEDFRKLRWPLLLGVSLTIAGIASLVLTEQYLDVARMGRASAQSQRTAAQDRVAKAAEEEREIRANLVEFQKMIDAGMVGSKNRLDLIEQILTIKTQRKLFEIKYNIEPQRLLDYPNIAKSGAMDLYTSRMRLSMPLLHEQDLFNFLDDLRDLKQAFVSVRSCNLVRQDRGSSPTLAPSVQSECILDLITLVDNKPS